jgi:hypothetical protein
MKVLNIFKKKKKVTSIVNVEKLEKNQLVSVIGGSTPIGGIIVKGGHNPK